jgi:hypothetical protein
MMLVDQKTWNRFQAGAFPASIARFTDLTSDNCAIASRRRLSEFSRAASGILLSVSLPIREGISTIGRGSCRGRDAPVCINSVMKVSLSGDATGRRDKLTAVAKSLRERECDSVPAERADLARITEQMYVSHDPNTDLFFQPSPDRHHLPGPM